MLYIKKKKNALIFFLCTGKKILVLDRNPYYGGETASLNLTNLYNTFKPSNIYI